MKKIVLLGGGELGKEFVIEAKRLGNYVIVIDNHHKSPAGQIADESYPFDMLDGEKLKKFLEYLKPDIIVPEIEAIDTTILYDLEKDGIQIVPSARAVNLTMNRDKIRNRAFELGIRTANFSYATSKEEYLQKIEDFDYPFVIKPIMSSSGKGQSIVKSYEEAILAWDYALENMRGNTQKVIIEEFIDFKYELTLLSVKTNDGIKYCYPIKHLQKNGDYQWSEQKIDNDITNCIREMSRMAGIIINDLTGNGIFGVEFFITKDNTVIFSELSPRPHDTGMVTMISQNTNQFELHLRSILDYKINEYDTETNEGASAVILSNIESTDFEYNGIEEAMKIDGVKVRIFGKEEARKNRRMGVVLAKTLDDALKAQSKIIVAKK